MKRSTRLGTLVTIAIASLVVAACSSSADSTSGSDSDAGQSTSAAEDSPAAEPDDHAAGDDADDADASSEASEEQPAEPQKVTFLLNWTVGPDHAAYFAAKEKGWYAENGIDVDITFGKGSATTAIGVASGQYDIGLADASSVIQAAGQAAPLEMVGMVYALGPQTGWTLADSGITTPADFPGKKIGTPAGDAQRILFPALASANGIDPDSVTWVNVDPGAKVAALASGSVDIVFDFENGQANYDSALGKDNYNKILWRDYGVNLYGNALFTSQDFAKEHGDLLKGFLDASYRGWAWVMENPEDAIDLLHDAVPELDVPTSLQNMPITLSALKDTAFAEHGLGWMDEDRMCQTVDIVQEYLEVEEKPTCESFFTNEFLSAVPLPANMQP